jgi:uncharacterized protein YndB with AHSA1/START domain
MTQATAQVSRTINAPADEVWTALTDPKIIKTYFFGADVQTDWKVGSPVKIKGEMKGKSYEDRGEVRSFEPQRRLSFSHYSPMSGAPDTPDNYHLVTYDLQPEGDRTRVTLTQSNLTGGVRDSDVEHKADYEKNWAMVLDGLDKAVGQ